MRTRLSMIVALLLVPSLAGAYYDANEPVVDKQLERAGVRLARILNEVLQ